MAPPRPPTDDPFPRDGVGRLLLGVLAGFFAGIPVAVTTYGIAFAVWKSIFGAVFALIALALIPATVGLVTVVVACPSGRCSVRRALCAPQALPLLLVAIGILGRFSGRASGMGGPWGLLALWAPPAALGGLLGRRIRRRSTPPRVLDLHKVFSDRGGSRP